MYPFPKPLQALAISATFLFPACGKDETKKETKETKSEVEKVPESGEPSPPTKVIKGQPSDDKTFAAEMMRSYELCRALLAADTGEGVADCANGIAVASKSAQAEAPEAAGEHIASLAKAAEALAGTKPDDMGALRLSFGGVSEAVVAMLRAAPDTARHYHVFECPMAKGYKRWVQPGATLDNPYMGAKMLRCGSEVDDPFAGAAKEAEAKDSGEAKAKGKAKDKAKGAKKRIDAGVGKGAGMKPPRNLRSDGQSEQ